MAHWPYVCMNKPFKAEYANIEWEYNQGQFKAWCEGKTGYPIVDAASKSYFQFMSTQLIVFGYGSVKVDVLLFGLRL